jgi:hypothetical protein
MARDDKPRGSLFGYVLILALSVIIAWVFVRPLGLQVRDLLQSLVAAFSNRPG